MQICERDCPNRSPGCHDTCGLYKDRLDDLHRRQEYLKNMRGYHDTLVTNRRDKNGKIVVHDRKCMT